jgi:hypothetical protein
MILSTIGKLSAAANSAKSQNLRIILRAQAIPYIPSLSQAPAFCVCTPSYALVSLARQLGVYARLALGNISRHDVLPSLINHVCCCNLAFVLSLSHPILSHILFHLC